MGNFSTARNPDRSRQHFRRQRGRKRRFTSGPTTNALFSESGCTPTSKCAFPEATTGTLTAAYSVAAGQSWTMRPSLRTLQPLAIRFS